MKFSQKSKFKASRMTKIADFDLLILPNLILCEICASESENLESVTLLKGEFSQNIKIKDIQNDQNCSFIPNFTWNLSVTKWKLQISLPRTVGHFTKRTLFMLLLTFMVWYRPEIGFRKLLYSSNHSTRAQIMSNFHINSSWLASIVD